ncbi:MULTISPECIES: DUF4249 domain-containing protein [Rufibacter]|uniref:DUF4249 domain-containing protein n=1 Tax=Rufibacter quisquiliarum TaxID=1549639 RepID=A0A839GGZ4_9BACT|nr:MULTISPECIES: DUF4249 domain-containing protein [Rufibacter]MBA9078162.1 hypothetical protein [Rufibacter quisquiliarum]
MIKCRKLKFFCCLLLLIGGCVEEYELPETATDLKLLVVDGNINLDDKIAVVKLSRTQDLVVADQEPVQEHGAQVSIEDESGQRFQLKENPIQEGRYTGYNASWAYNKKYKLHIKTSQGKEYQSEFVSTHKTPAIDSLTWSVEGGKVILAANTHDSANKTRYYKWEYVETYEYKSYMESAFMYTGNWILVLRPSSSQIYTCWATTPSTTILVGSSAHLAKDIIAHYPLVIHEGDGDRFGIKFSLLVHQYAISKGEFDYWTMLRKNTESVGSLFDAQPSYVTGNVSSVKNLDEPVFGYFSARSRSSKRVFIEAKELKKWGFKPKWPECRIFEAAGEPIPSNMNVVSAEINPTTGRAFPTLLATKECTDCRLKGGDTRRPDFW